MLGRTIGISILAICSSFARAQQPVLLGVLEDLPRSSARSVPTAAVQVMFQSVDGEWRPYSDESPAPLPGDETLASWNVSLAGQNLGQVRSRASNDSDPDEALGKQVVLGRAHPSRTNVPKLQNASFASPAPQRPLVVNSKPFAKDPENWKPIDIARNIEALVSDAFHERNPPTCAQSPSIAAAYRADNDWYLVEVSSTACTNSADNSFAPTQWFIVNPMLQAEFLGEGLRLLDAGDYDNDGVSELMFSIARPGRAGYELFYDAFRGHITFEYDAPPLVAAAY